MRVAIVAESYLPYVSGVTVSTETLARGLGARGHEVLLVAPRPARGESPGTQGAAGPEPRYAWLPSYQLPVRAPRGYRMPLPLPGPAVGRALRFRPQIVHVQGPFVAGWLARRLARRSGARLVFTHHTRFSQYRHYLGPAGRPADLLVTRYLRRFWAACDAVVAPAADLAQEIRAGLPRDASTRVRVIPTGIDVAAIQATPPIDPRPPAGWPADTVVATILGRLAEEKSVDVVIDAVALAARSVPSLRLSVVGDGPARQALEERARALLGERAWFAGARPRAEALALVRGADLFCFASRTETQGLVLAEALACGLPAVALEGPGVRDSVRDGIDGIIVERGSDPAASLAPATALLAGDASRRRALAAEAAAGAERFDVAARLADVEALYGELIAAG